MTRTLFILAGLLFLGVIAALGVGLAGNAPGLMMLSILCVAPLFMLALGAAIGRASNEFAVVRKERNLNAAAQRTQRTAGRPAQGESLG